jgi:hypothetical protein
MIVIGRGCGWNNGDNCMHPASQFDGAPVWVGHSPAKLITTF